MTIGFYKVYRQSGGFDLGKIFKPQVPLALRINLQSWTTVGCVMTDRSDLLRECRKLRRKAS